MPQPSVVIGVDIGGTKIKAAAVIQNPKSTIQNLPGACSVVADDEVPTPRAAPPAFYDEVAALIRRVAAGAQAQGCHVEPIVSIAHPGRFLPDGTLARATTPNIGATPGQFDGLHPADELRRRLQMHVLVENDAISQMRFGLAALLRDPSTRSHLLGQVVVYLGPGTGMGGGVARVGADGSVTPVTDGHLFDMQVPGIRDGSLTAEELFTGPAIAKRVAGANEMLSPPIEPARAGRLDEILCGAAAPAAHRQVAERIADQQGHILAAIIQALHEGRVTKVRLESISDGSVRRHVDEPDRAWSTADRALVRGVRRFLFGGFVGSSRGLGVRIRQQALEELAERGISDVRIMPVPATSGDAGVLGAVCAIQSVVGRP